MQCDRRCQLLVHGMSDAWPLVVPAADMATPIYAVFGFIIVQMVHILTYMLYV